MYMVLLECMYKYMYVHAYSITTWMYTFGHLSYVTGKMSGGETQFLGGED